MKILVNINGEKERILAQLMAEDLETNRSGYMGFLVVQEWKRRQEEKNKKSPGRPSKGQADASSSGDGDGDGLPDENAPRTEKIPEHLKQYVPRYEREKLVNEYDIVMLEAKAELPK